MTALRRQSDARGIGQRPPDGDDCNLISEILHGRSLPVRDVVVAAPLEREDRADRLTAEQAALLKVTGLLNPVEVRGGAGSGRTVLAQTQARELAADGNGRSPQRVALVCYCLGLASGIKRATRDWSRRKRPGLVGSFQELARYLGVTEFADRDNSSFWEVELPCRMAELATVLPDGRKFDAVVVDEAQDFAHDWWDPLLGILRDPDSGGLYAYSDENQRVFARFGRPAGRDGSAGARSKPALHS